MYDQTFRTLISLILSSHCSEMIEPENIYLQLVCTYFDIPDTSCQTMKTEFTQSH